MSTPKYATHRPAGREHFPEFPRGFIAIRIVQLVLAVVILGLCGFGVAFLVFAGNALSLFTAIATLIVTIYHLVAQFGSPRLYNYWAVLSLDIFLLIFWLISFAILGAQVSAAFAGTVACDYYSGYCDVYGLDDGGVIYFGCLAGAAGLGGAQFVLFVVSLSIVGVKVHRHRAAGLHCAPAPTAPGPHGHPTTPTISAPSQVEKGRMEPQAQPVYPQQYQQQPVPAQQHFAQQSHAAVPSQPTPPPQAHAAPPPPPQQQQQQFYSQQAASPLSSQPTGGSYQPPQYQQPGMPAPAQGPPYEAHGHPTQHTH